MRAIGEASARAGRDPGEVTLVAVTKSVNATIAARLVAAGHHDFGENRVQELVTKAAALSGVRWHLIGPLQSNKIRKAIRTAHLLHAIDSKELYQPIDRIAGEEGRAVSFCIEINVSRETTKHGISPEGALDALEAARELRNARAVGLMTMAPLGADTASIRNIFRTLRGIRDAAVQRGLFASGRGELSMGMSGDFTIAVEEGATLVRVGSALFESTPCAVPPGAVERGSH